MSRGDDKAFEAFVHAHGTALVRIAGALSGDPSFSEEVVQSALERVFVRWRKLDDPLAYAQALLKVSVPARFTKLVGPPRSLPYLLFMHTIWNRG